jgi:aminomethyltransferase
MLETPSWGFGPLLFLFFSFFPCFRVLFSSLNRCFPSYKNETIIASHLHCRQSASLFDVSHMTQLEISGADRQDFVETLFVAGLEQVKHNSATLSLMTNKEGGIIDDCMITKKQESIYVVLNAGCKDKDLYHLFMNLARWKADGKDVDIDDLTECFSLLALQGPKAAAVLGQVLEGGHGEEFLKSIPFLGWFQGSIFGCPVNVSRCGYTGEDGFEISLRHEDLLHVTDNLVGDGTIVKPAGLGINL